MADNTKDYNTYEYPMTKMSFVVSCDKGTAAFTEVTGVESTVDVIEYRVGNAKSLGLSKIPGLVHHGNVTLRLGVTQSNAFITWAQACVSEHRTPIERQDIAIELIDVGSRAGYEGLSETSTAGSAGGKVWYLRHAFVTKLNLPDLDAKTSDIAIMSMEIAYEELDFNGSGAAG